MFCLMSILHHEILLYTFKFKFSHPKSPWFHKRNMQNNYPTKHDPLRAIFMQPSHKINMGAAEKSSRESKGYISGYQN